MEIKKVGVVGMTGTMGTGIAQVCAQSGYQVVGFSRSEERLQKGLASITSFLTRSVEKEKITQQDKDSTLGRIKTTTNMQDFNDCGLVIEAIVEDMDAKKKLFAELDKICPKDAILATNTSSLSVIEIAKATTKPDKVLGLHFFNPVPLMKLMEVVKTLATSDETIQTGKSFGESLGKTTIIAPDTPGFIVNRLQYPFRLTAIELLEAGIATKEDIDAAATLGLNHPMGPLALQDLVGLDVTYAATKSIYEEIGDTKYAPPLLMKKMVSAGWLGRKTGKGFYDYNK
ncbi:3-hydroxyacyl-CoA dehydrogenase family protein [Chloroflexota bacterium]